MTKGLTVLIILLGVGGVIWMVEEAHNSASERLAELPKGLSAVVLPDQVGRGIRGENGLATEQETVDRLNSFLQELNRQGADIVSILEMDVNMGKRDDTIGHVTETKRFAIVRR